MFRSIDTLGSGVLPEFVDTEAAWLVPPVDDGIVTVDMLEKFQVALKDLTARLLDTKTCLAASRAEEMLLYWAVHLTDVQEDPLCAPEVDPQLQVFMETYLEDWDFLFMWDEKLVRIDLNPKAEALLGIGSLAPEDWFTLMPEEPSIRRSCPGNTAVDRQPISASWSTQEYWHLFCRVAKVNYWCIPYIQGVGNDRR